MGRCVGESSVVFADGSVYRLDDHFPAGPARVALSMSGGVESTLLLAILVRRYGPKNVIVFSGEFKGRRQWESTHPLYLSNMMGVTNVHALPISNHHMSSQDNWDMFVKMKPIHNFEYWFNGTNAKLFSSRNVTEPHTVDHIKKQGYIVPFVWLEKWQTIDLYGLLGFGNLLSKSHSCTVQPPEMGHCGSCFCCMERAYGFTQLGKPDPTTYSIPLTLVHAGIDKFIEENST